MIKFIVVLLAATAVAATLGSTVVIKTDPSGNPLNNYETYIVGVAAFDEVGNVGLMSTFECGQPQPTKTFLQEIAGTMASRCTGCGNCTIGASSDLTWNVLGWTTLAGVGIFVRRRAVRRGRGLTRPGTATNHGAVVTSEKESNSSRRFPTLLTPPCERTRRVPVWPAVAFASTMAGLLVTGVASPAAAQMMHVPNTDWRQSDRHDASGTLTQPKDFYVEARFAPYWPNIDSEFTNATPFADTFGLPCGTNTTGKPSVGPGFYFGVELDYVPIRVPYVGGLGLGVGWGYTSFSATAALANGGCSGDTTTLMIMPMYGVLALRVDELQRRMGVPIVPYGKAGVGVAYWNASTEGGTETYQEKNGTVSGNGLTPSLHLALGAMLSLNFLDPHAGARLDTTSGIGHAYIFAEYMNELSVLSNQVMRVGTSTFVGGLAADF